MATIDWPTDLSQTYVNVRLEDLDEEEQRTPALMVAVDDDHQAVGKHTLMVDAAGARAHAVAHRAVATALDAMADHLDEVNARAAEAVDEPSPLPPAPPTPVIT